MGARLHGVTAWLVYGITALVVVFILAPLAVVMALSVTESAFASFPPTGFTLRWYWAVLTDRSFQEAALLSIGLALATTLSSLLLGTPAAFVLVRARFRGRDFCQMLLLSPLVFPTLIIGLALLQFFSLTGMQIALVGLFIAHTLVTLPYVVRTVAASLQLVDQSLEEAARTLGASRMRSFLRVIVPQIMPGIVAGALFAFMVSLDNYPASMWLADARTVPLPVLMYQAVGRVFDPSVAVMSSMKIIIGIGAVLILERIVGLRRAMGV